MIPPMITQTGYHRLACGQCGDTGKLLASKIGVRALPYAFRCTCDTGRRSSMGFPRWEPGLSLKFEIITGIQETT